MRLLIILFKHIFKILTPPDEKRLRRILLRMKWADFEIYITDMFARYGYDRVYRTGSDGPDGGKDVVIEHQVNDTSCNVSTGLVSRWASPCFVKFMLL